MMGEVDQIPNDEPFEIKIKKEAVYNTIDENCPIMLSESANEEGTIEKNFHILKFEKEES